MAITLTYFDFHGGRGEDCRLALHLAGVDFTDDRVQRGRWMELKPTTPFGGLPLYEEDGRMLTEANAILVYLGRTHGLHPTDPWEAAEHEQIMSAVEYLRGSVPRPKDPSELQSQRTAWARGPFTQWARTVESKIAGPFVAGDRLNVVDLKLYNFVNGYITGTMDHVGPEYLEPFARLRGLHRAVREHEGVHGYYAQFD